MYDLIVEKIKKCQRINQTIDAFSSIAFVFSTGDISEEQFHDLMERVETRTKEICEKFR